MCIVFFYSRETYISRTDELNGYINISAIKHIKVPIIMLY